MDGLVLRTVARTVRAMSTFVTVTVRDRSRTRAEEAIGRAFCEMERVTALLNRFEASSALGALNQAGRLADPPEELRTVLGRALALHRSTGGAFDPTVAPLVDLYQVHFAASGGPPDEAELREVRGLVAADAVRLRDRSVRLEREGMALTLDGIAKGYVVDRMVETLTTHGVRHALVDAGGDIRALGGRSRGRPWRVGVQDPRRAGGLVEVIELADAAVATSGDYVVFYDVERRYHHTVVPATGASPREVSSVTVLGASAMDADALATAAFVLGPGAGLRLLGSAAASGLVQCRSGLLQRSDGWPSVRSTRGT